jgi:hypothetical protein
VQYLLAAIRTFFTDDQRKIDGVSGTQPRRKGSVQWAIHRFRSRRPKFQRTFDKLFAAIDLQVKITETVIIDVYSSAPLFVSEKLSHRGASDS